MKKVINDIIKSALTPKVYAKLENCAYGEDVIDILLNHTSDKLEGYDSYGSEFDVSYLGSETELQQELFKLLQTTGFEPEVGSNNKIYFNLIDDDAEVEVSIVEDDEASTYSENSRGYFIDVQTIL